MPGLASTGRDESSSSNLPFSYWQTRMLGRFGTMGWPTPCVLASCQHVHCSSF